MKKYLLAGTSAFALALTAGAANAQSAPGKFDVKISGDAYFEAGLVSKTLDKSLAGAGGETPTLNAGDFINRFRLTVNPEAKADNGLVYGVNARLRANGSAGTIDGDRAYIYATAAFGTVQAGVVNGPSDATYVSHPQDWQLLGNYDQWKYYVQTVTSAGLASNANEVPNKNGSAAWAWGQFGSGSATSPAAAASEGVQLLHAHDIDTKVVYYTPRFLGSSPTTGLQGAISYAPHIGSGYDGGVSVNTGVTRSNFANAGILDSSTVATAFQQVTAFRDAYELTANYTEKFGAWLVKGSIGYEGGKAMKVTATDINNYNDLSSFQVGVLVGYNDFQVGGGFVDAFKSGYRKTDVTAGTTDYKADQTSWNVGAQYTWGPAVFGVKYLAQRDAGDLKTPGDRTLDSVTAGTMYTVAPGLRTGLEYTYFQAKSDLILDPVATGTAKKETGSIVLVRGVVSF